MRDKWSSLPAVIRFANRCPCMWVYFGSGPVPVNWHVSTVSDRVHYLDGLWSIAGPVAAAIEVCVAERECFPGLLDRLILHYYRPCVCPVRPLKLQDYCLADIPVGRKHEYVAGPGKPKRAVQPPTLF